MEDPDDDTPRPRHGFPPRLRYSRPDDDDDDDDDDLEEPEEEEEEPEEEEDDADDGSEPEDDEPGPTHLNLPPSSSFSSSSSDDEDDDDDESTGKRRQKRRRLDRIAGGFEFAPRAAPAPASRPVEWSEASTVLLLDAWGSRYVANGRRSLRPDEWAEVAKKLSRATRVPRSEAQCRNRLDTLKKRYKKEKMRPTTDWVYFARLDAILSPSPPPEPRLGCGFDAGEFVFADSRLYASRSNDHDELRDTPENSYDDDDDDDNNDDDEDNYDDDDESDGLPPERTARSRPAGSTSSSFRMLADSIRKFGEIYEKIELGKRRHMDELERMRKAFHEDLELQKKRILERAQAEIAKIRHQQQQDDDDDNDHDDDDDDNGNDDEEDDNDDPGDVQGGLRQHDNGDDGDEGVHVKDEETDEDSLEEGSS